MTLTWKLFGAPFVCLLLLVPLKLNATLTAEILHTERARIQDGVFLITPDPDINKPVGLAPLIVHLTQPMPSQTPMGIEVTAQSSEDAELELVGYYTLGQNFLFPRRSLEGGSMQRLRWEIPSPDRMTSFTLNVRAPGDGEVRVGDLDARSFEPLLTPYRLNAYHNTPMFSRRVGEPVMDDILDLVIQVPEFLKPGMASAKIEIIDGSGTEYLLDIPVTLAQTRDDPNFGRIHVPFDLGGEWTGPLKATLVFPDRGREDIRLSPLMIETGNIDGPFYEAPGRSVESLFVMVHNEELVFYTALADVGVARTSTATPLPTMEIFLTVGDGENWVTEESIFPFQPDVDWMLGGASGLTVGRFGNTFHMIFTLTGLDGREGIGTAQGIDSLRFVPSPRNPVWQPQAREDGTPAGWRDNALMNFNGTLVLAGLHEVQPGQTRFQLLHSEFPWRWTDFGSFPLPGHITSNSELSLQERNGEFQLLMGPNIGVYQTTHPLWGWEAGVTPDNLPPWSQLQIVNWQGVDHVFGIEERNGRGIVRWKPLGE